ncbi:hypothetical protein KC317_g49 [Hortaea werneckii]|nr:hypothetical protein KC317_g49 [Hortaea werneckii]KAI7628654.1 hypothetical protein KC346_g53 [Hortaea werneckii]
MRFRPGVPGPVAHCMIYRCSLASGAVITALSCPFDPALPELHHRPCMAVMGRTGRRWRGVQGRWARGGRARSCWVFSVTRSGYAEGAAGSRSSHSCLRGLGGAGRGPGSICFKSCLLRDEFRRFDTADMPRGKARQRYRQSTVMIGDYHGRTAQYRRDKQYLTHAGDKPQYPKPR